MVFARYLVTLQKIDKVRIDAQHGMLSGATKKSLECGSSVFEPLHAEPGCGIRLSLAGHLDFGGT